MNQEKAQTRLIQSALKLFAKDGYHASSMARIAKEAGVSKALTYHYFDSKEALLVVLAEMRLQELAPLIAGLERIEEPRERLFFLIDFALEELQRDTEKLRFFNALFLTEAGVRAIEQAMTQFSGQFERLFFCERKLFADLGFSDPDLEATFLRSTLQGISLEYMLGPKDYPLAVMKEKILSRYQ